MAFSPMRPLSLLLFGLLLRMERQSPANCSILGTMGTSQDHLWATRGRETEIPQESVLVDLICAPGSIAKAPPSGDGKRLPWRFCMMA